MRAIPKNDLFNKYFLKSKSYKYKIEEDRYIIYSGKDNRIDWFFIKVNEKYFNENFVDIKKLRKKKLEEINSNEKRR